MNDNEGKSGRTLQGLFWEESFLRREGRAPTEAEIAEYEVRVQQYAVEERASLTPEQRKLREEGLNMWKRFFAFLVPKK